MIVRGAPIACARNRIPSASSTARKQRMPYGDGKHKRSRPVWQTRAAPYLNAFFRNGRQVSRGRRTFPTRSPTRNLSKSERVLLRMARFRPRAAHRNEPQQRTKQPHTAPSSTHGHGERREAAGQVPGVRRFHSRARGKTSGAYPVFATVSVPPTGAGKDGKRDSIRRKVFEEKRGGVW